MKRILLEPFKYIDKYWVPLFVFIIYAVTTNHLFGESCIFELLLGFPCPACGITRALESALMLDFKAAFNYHPLFLLAPFILILIIYKDYKYINKIYKSSIVWIVMIILLIGVYIYRMITVYPNEPLNYNKYALLQIIIRFIKGLFA